MPQISNLSFNVSFEPHNPNRVGLTNTTPSLPAGFVGIFKVTQPDGYVRNGDINTPDVTNVVSSCVVTLVPDSAGQLQQGQYIIEFIGNAPGYLSTSFIRTFTLQYTAATISLRNDFDIFTPQLAYTDISNYSVSGWTISSGPTRKWDATSPTTGTISGTNSSINIRYNNQYYAENYTIQFEVNVAYASQAYPWLTITHTRTQTTSVTACIPKSLEDLTQAVEALREESNASCGGDWAKFEKANALYAHLLNMLRLVLIAGQHQDGFFDVYQQLLTYIQNGSVACTTIGQVIPPYDFSDYESSIYDGQSSYCQLVGDGVNTTYRVNHQLGDTCVVVQVYEVATGKQVFCDLAVSTINSIDITFYEPPTLNQYRVVAVAGAIGLRGQGFQPGGLTGQILRKKTNADFDTEWADVTVALPLLVPYTGATQDVFLGEFGIETGYVRFDTTPTAAPAVPAVMSWNDQEGTVDLRLKGNNVTLQVGQEMVARVVNKTGANLLESQYKAVRIRKVSEGGAQGQRLAVVLAQANTEFLSTDMLGIVTENISNNQEGFITTFGAVKNIDTTGALQGEVWADGDILFLSPTVAGGLTKVKPSAPDHLSIVGYVEYAHQNNGKIFVHVQTSWELDELHNVAISSLTTGQVLRYDGTLWRNAAVPAVTSIGLATSTTGVTITDTPVTSSGVININIATAAAGQSGLLSASDWATFNAKQSAITLTTTGNSGAATFVGSTLNIPNYTLAGLGGVPSTRSLTINGTAYDLSADRVWSVGTVTSVAALTIGTAGTDITSTVATGTTTPVITLNIPTASAANRGALSAADWTTFNNKQNALTNPVTGTGTTNYIPKFTAASTIGNSLLSDDGVELKYTGADGATIQGTTSAFLSLYGTGDNYIQFKDAAGTAGRIQYNHTSDYMSFNTASTERLRITSGGNVGIGTASPSQKLHVSGGNLLVQRAYSSGNIPLEILNSAVASKGQSYDVGFFQANDAPSLRITEVNSADNSITGELTLSAGDGNVQLIGSTGPMVFNAGRANSSAGYIVGTNHLRIFANGRIGVNTTTDAGYQFDINGTLRSVNGANFATTSGNVGVGTVSPQNDAGYKSITINGTSGGQIGFYAGGIQQTNMYGDATGLTFVTTAATPISFLTNSLTRMTINSGGDVGIGVVNATEKLDVNGRMRVRTIDSTETAINMLYADATGVIKKAPVPTGTISGSGTTNYIPKFTAASTIGNSQIFDNGTNVGVGTASPLGKFHIESTAAQGATALTLRTSNSSGPNSTIRWVNDVNTQTVAIGSNYGVANNGIEFIIGTTTQMNLRNNGNLLVGTTTDAGYKTDIAGTLRSTLGANFATTSGNVGIGTSGPAYKLDVNGTLGVTGAAAFSSSVTAANFYSIGGFYTTGFTIPTSAKGVISNSNYGGPAWNNASFVTGNGATGVMFGGDNGSYTYAWLQGVQTDNGTIKNLAINPLGGNVGINTSSPSAKLHVVSVGTAGNTLPVNASSIFEQSGNNVVAISGGSADEAGVFFPRSTVAYYGGVYRANDNLILRNNDAERARLNSAGELLINTTSDAGDYKLQVAGNIYNTGSAVLAATSGNVGIGTASPVHTLHLNSSFTTYVHFTNTASGTTNADGMSIGLDGSDYYVWVRENRPLYIGTNSTTRLLVQANGRVAINTTTDAGYQLDVNGGTRVTGRVTVTGNDTLGLSIARAGTSAISSEIYNGGGDNGWLLWGVESSAGGVIFPGTTAYASVFGSFRNVPIQFATNNTVRMTIDGGGSVGIGVASPSASAILQVDSTTKGMLPPRMTTTQRDAITSPATGLIVYDTTVNKLSVYNGTTWKYAQYE